MVRYVAVGLALGVALLLGLHGMGEAGTRELVRWTARTSLLFLCAALAAEGKPALVPAWAGRPALLRSLALSHGVHGVAVVILSVLLGGRNLAERASVVSLAGGVLAYAFIFWGAIRPDARLTSLGLFWVWSVFMVSYGGRALRTPVPYALAVALLVLAMLARLWPSPGSVERAGGPQRMGC
jgi:methionine sulfoxide reductase heme-binding subunit